MPRHQITPLIDRLMAKVSMEPNSGCWLWLGADNGNGYGVIGLGRDSDGIALAHRVAYELFRGPIPDGFEPDHTCRVRCCINPWHLEIVTHAENVRRGLAGKYQCERTHCPSGHPYSPENTTLYRGRRRCKTCDRLSSSRAYHHKKALSAASQPAPSA